MARYEHLPIYKKAMELGIYMQNAVRNFSRYNKYTIGADMRNLSRNIIKLIIIANSSKEKAEVLAELVGNCEMLKTMIVFAKEIKAFSNFKSFQHAASLAASLCKQSEGWLKSSRKSQSHRPPSNVGR
ncbi:MAG: four helix bundle protein [Armatimonadetes bacterium]|nr:four helix bundle protein [Armatimonadota bacterium]